MPWIPYFKAILVLALLADGNYCPKEYPNAYYGGHYCCLNKLEKDCGNVDLNCTGGRIGLNSTCCLDDKFISCRKAPCQNYDCGCDRNGSIDNNCNPELECDCVKGYRGPKCKQCSQGYSRINDSCIDMMTCIWDKCLAENTACFGDSECKRMVACMPACKFQGFSCLSECNLTKEILRGPTFKPISNCVYDNNCATPLRTDGVCLASDDQALSNITNMSSIAGEWWVVKGLNCGQDDLWVGGFNWLPCQHMYFNQTEDGTWISNRTYCLGKNNDCKGVLETIGTVNLTSPGVMRHNYSSSPDVFGPHFEDWKVVSLPHHSWALVIWCSRNRFSNFNGGFVMSRERSLSTLPGDVETELRKSATKFGIDYDGMCESDNRRCTN